MKLLLAFIARFFGHRRRLLAGMACVPVVVLCDIQLTLLIGDALTELRIEEQDNSEFLMGVFGLMLLIGAVQGVFRFLQRWWIVGVSRMVEVELKQELFDKLSGLPLSFHNKSRSGDIVSRLTADVENVRMLLGPGSMYVLSAIFFVPGSLFVLGRISPILTLSMTLPLVGVALVMYFLTPKLHVLSTSMQESLADISHNAQESFAGARVIKGYGLEAHRSRSFESSSRENRGAQIRFQNMRAVMHAAIHLAYDLAFLPILFVGGMAMIDRSIAVGDLFKFIDLGFKVFWPVIALGWIAGLYPRALASAQRIQSLLSENEDIRDPANPVALEPETIQGELSLANVSYTYEDAPRPALSGIDVHVPPKSILGVVGPTGSGKTTLLNLLGRLFEPQGEIRLDGVPTRHLSLSTLRGALAYVPQDSFLFSDTYRANLEFGVDEELSEERLAQLIDDAGMTDEVAEFQGGLDQMIGERGVTLSGGQRQRTCIARALARDPGVLILDDALSAVDTETEARLLHSLRRAGDGRTVVIAAHRLATVKNADLIIALDNGKLDAQGSHEELLERSPWYRQTWDRQRMQEELHEL